MKLRKLSISATVGLAALLATSLASLTSPALAAERPGEISGYVRNASGIPQMGAAVEILGVATHTLTVFTDGSGFYSATDLIPGFYTLKVSAPSFLPALRERVGLHPGASLNVNVTLNTLLGAMQLGPVRATPDDDDWKWTLRSVANRPVLRILDDPNSAVPDFNATVADAESPDGPQRRELTGTLSFLAGSDAEGYGSGSDMSTGFTLERSVFSASRVGLSGNVGYGDNSPAAVLRTSYSRALPDGSEASVALTMRRFAPSDPNLHNAALQAMALSAGDQFSVGDLLEFKFGSELQTIQFLGRVTAFRPYGAADLHLSPNTVLAYGYATSLPDNRSERGFDSAPADLSESNPRVSMQGFSPKLEHAHHHELNLSRHMGRTSVQAAVYSDRVVDTALTGTGEVTSAGGYLLPDVYSGTFSYAGKTLDSNGLRLVLQRKLTADLTATLDYAYGGVLDLSRPDVPLQDAQQWIGTAHRQAIAAKLSGTVRRTHTRYIASYRWVNGSALTPVDAFNASAGQAEPFFNVFLRQPLPNFGFISSHMEALVDVRNLLAQGYVPVLAQDGQTVYLVQSARAVRAGLAFNF